MLNSENLRKLESEEGAMAELTKEHSKLRAEYERKGARHVALFPAHNSRNIQTTFKYFQAEESPLRACLGGRQVEGAARAFGRCCRGGGGGPAQRARRQGKD